MEIEHPHLPQISVKSFLEWCFLGSLIVTVVVRIIRYDYRTAVYFAYPVVRNPIVFLFGKPEAVHHSADSHWIDFRPVFAKTNTLKDLSY